MNILYLHGLDSRLNNQKREVLEKHGEVYAPEIDYRKNPDKMRRLISEFKDKNIEVVIGSSMGGYMGYHVADAFEVPALVFNPALAYRSVPQEVVLHTLSSNLKHIILGAKDKVVDPKSSLRFLADNLGVADFQIRIRQDLAHQIPLNIFEEEVNRFFKGLKHS